MKTTTAVLVVFLASSLPALGAISWLDSSGQLPDTGGMTGIPATYYEITTGSGSTTILGSGAETADATSNSTAMWTSTNTGQMMSASGPVFSDSDNLDLKISFYSDAGLMTPVEVPANWLSLTFASVNPFSATATVSVTGTATTADLAIDTPDGFLNSAAENLNYAAGTLSTPASHAMGKDRFQSALVGLGTAGVSMLQLDTDFAPDTFFVGFGVMPSMSAVPEPSPLMLLGATVTGGAFISFMRRRRRLAASVATTA